MPTVSTKVYVGNLPETCRRSDLLTRFEKFGKVAECDIVKNYAFVHFENPEDAKIAVTELDGSDFQGTAMKVQLSHSRVRQKPGMGGKNECYKCGKDGHWSKDCPRGGTRPRGGRSGDPYERDPYYDPYPDPYYRERLPPPPRDRYMPYPDPYERRLAERRLPPPPPIRDPYYRDRDPYARPPPEFYSRRAPPRDPYLDLYLRRPLPPLPGSSRDSGY